MKCQKYLISPQDLGCVGCQQSARGAQRRRRTGGRLEKRMNISGYDMITIEVAGEGTQINFSGYVSRIWCDDMIKVGGG